MTLFLLVCSALTLAALALVAYPLIKRTSIDPRLDALNAAKSAGVLSDEEYAIKRASLSNNAPSSTSPMARGAAVALVLLMPISALLLYLKLGDTRVFDPNVQSVTNAMQAAQRSGANAMDQAIAGLSERLVREPNDLDGWVLLGRAYSSTERFAEARDALSKATKLSPDNPAIMTRYAEAMALATPSRQFQGESLALLERALQIDPKHEFAMWLRGIAHYQADENEAAMAIWEKLLATMPADNPARATLLTRITELTGQTLNVAANTAPTAATDSPDANSGPQLKVRVALDPALQTKVKPDDVLFVFARAAEGSRAPVAIMRLRAADLPLDVTLNDSHAMMPAMSLSTTGTIVVGARISQSGNAMAQAGDLDTLSQPLPNTHSDTVELLINNVVQ